MPETQNLIIGTGPAGLAVAGRLKKRGIPFEIIEKSQYPANAWRCHYDRLHLHLIRSYSHLPYLPFPEDYPKYVPKDLLVSYYDHYVKHFDIRPKYGVEVVKISKRGTNWKVDSANHNSYITPNVILATGANHYPNRPKLRGEEEFGGTIIHSKSYKNPIPFLGKKALVIGMGNTGAEIALDLCEHGIPTCLSVRSPVNIIPREFMKRPVHQTTHMLSKLPNWLGDWLGAQLPKIAFGNLRSYGLLPSSIPPAKQLRETGKTPVIDIGTVQKIKEGKIKVVPALQALHSAGAVFVDGSNYSFDVCILATGYRPRLEKLLGPTQGLLNQDALPKTCIGEGKYKGLYFLGFNNYKPGSILGFIHEDSALIADEIEQGEVSATVSV